ncbi:hypothetical protein [Nocardia sp. CA-119907]|uniref:hypothetical protein n=1 Tax=Nocardia sp. CA-119907 TaxID=3239973 RepID=UPI003D953A92
MVRTVRMMVTVSGTVPMSMPGSRPMVVVQAMFVPVAVPMPDLGFVTIRRSVAMAVIWSVVTVVSATVCGIRTMAVRLGIPDIFTVSVRNDLPPFGIALVTHFDTA